MAEDGNAESDRLDDLIHQEGDEKTRLILIILNNINRNLVANTTLTQEIAAEQQVSRKLSPALH